MLYLMTTTPTDQKPASGANSTESLLNLADSWDGGEDQGVEHVGSCKDYGCRQCVLAACAADLRHLANCSHERTLAGRGNTHCLDCGTKWNS